MAAARFQHGGDGFTPVFRSVGPITGRCLLATDRSGRMESGCEGARLEEPEREACSKRQKELENAALQSSLSRQEGGGGQAREGLSLTDHLNRRLLLSFQEQLNRQGPPGMGRPPPWQRAAGAAGALEEEEEEDKEEEEDSNRVEEEW